MSNSNRISIPFYNQSRRKIDVTYQGTENDELDMSFTQPESKTITDYSKTMVYILMHSKTMKLFIG